MTKTFSNVYDDADRARAYAALEFPGTYYLAFRDLAVLLHKYVSGTLDLILAAFTFDNIPTDQRKNSALRELQRLLAARGRLVVVVSSPAIYRHEWASFSTREYPANRGARDGDTVRIIMLDVPDRRPVVDIVVCGDTHYRELFQAVGLCVVDVVRPLATGAESIQWVSETTIPPWTIYVLARPNMRLQEP